MPAVPFPFSRIFLGLLAGVFAFSPMPSGAVEPTRIVATGGRIAYTFYTPAAANTSFWQRTPHKLGGPVAEMQVGFMDWMYPTSGAETPNTGNDVTIGHAWLERASTGQVVPLLFNGLRTLVLPMNSTTPYWLSDPVPSASWNGSPPVKDEVFWLHVKGTIPSGGKTPVGTPANFTGARCIFYPPANDTGNVDAAGVVPTITGQVARTQGLPLIFLGRFTGPGHLSVIGVGDSILDGTGDQANPAPVISGYGFFNRAALDSAGDNTIAMFNLTRHGQTAFSWITPSRQTRQRPFLKFANVMVEEYGTNDLGQGGTGNPTEMLSRVEGIWSAARAEGVQKIVRTLLMPRTDSTNNWSDLAGQTPKPGWGAGGKRDDFNNSLIAAGQAGKFDLLLDTLDVLADPADRNRWRTNGAPNYTAADDAHVSRSGNQLLAPHLRNALLSLTVDRGDYASWAGGTDWQGQDPTPGGDADGDGVKNLISYALDVPPVGSAALGEMPTCTLDTTTPGGPWHVLTFRENLEARDITVVLESSPDLATWTPVVPDGTTAILETIAPNVDGDGTAALRRIRLKQDPVNPHRFMRLRVEH